MSPRTLTVEGTLNNPVDNEYVEYIAASPPDSLQSFSGSGLPFASAQQAFDNTPTRGSLKTSKVFRLQIVEPNSYYTDLGTRLVGPTLYIRYMSKGSQCGCGTRTCRTTYRISNPNVPTSVSWHTIYRSQRSLILQGAFFWCKDARTDPHGQRVHG
jgi:hypothetical protein